MIATRHRGRLWTALSGFIARLYGKAGARPHPRQINRLRASRPTALPKAPASRRRVLISRAAIERGAEDSSGVSWSKQPKRGPSMRTLSLVLALLFVTAASGAAAQPELKTDEQKTLYALGLVLAQNLGQFALSPAELEIVKAGLTDGVTSKDKKVDLQTYGPKIQELQKTRVTAAAVPERKAGQAFVDKAAAEKGAVKTPSGAVVTTLKPGTGPAPAAGDKVKVHYQGTLTDGGKSRLVCPADTAYGDRGAPPKIKPGATLVFEVELLEIVK